VSLSTLPRFLQEELAKPPRSGQGVHLWLFKVARQLHAHLPANDIVRLLEERLQTCGRNVPRREIVDAVRNALSCAWQPGNSSSQPTNRVAPKWPSLDRDRRDAIIRAGGSLVALWDASPVQIDTNKPRTEEILDHLFGENDLLCCGRTQADFETRSRFAWRGELGQLQFLVPSPMSAMAGLTKDGRESAHALSNTGPRRFLVTEFDSGTADEQAALLIHLAGYAPLVCVVHSGGKSLHGWFLVAGQPDDKVLRFFKYALSLGADPATWCRSQFVRIPDGIRENGRRQTVFFLNLDPLEDKP
jgi:hypothetical protein